MKSASSEARKTAAFPMSAGCPTRPHGYLDRDPLLPERALGQVAGDLREADAGADAVDADAVFGQRQRGGLGDHLQAGLRRVVVDVVGVRHRVVDRADVDDHAAAPLLDPIAPRLLRAHEGRLQVGVHDEVPRLVGEVEEVHAPRHAGVVDQDVEPAKLADGLADHAGDVGALRDVGFDGDGVRARLAHRRGGVLSAGGVDVDDGDAGALARHLKGDAASDPHAAAGDQRHPAFELHASGPSRRTCRSGRGCPTGPSAGTRA